MNCGDHCCTLHITTLPLVLLLPFTRQGSGSAAVEGASAERRKDRRCHQLHLQYCMEEIWQGTWRIDSSRVSKPCFEPSSRKIPSPYEVLIHCLHDLHFSCMHYCVRFRTHRPRTSSPLVLYFRTLHTSIFEISRQTARQTGSTNSRADCAACCSWQRAVHRSDCSRHRDTNALVNALAPLHLVLKRRC